MKNLAKGAYLRQPTIKIDFVTEVNTFSLKYGTAEQGDVTSSYQKLASGGISDGIISFTTENDMKNDSATFSLVLVGTTRWDRVLTTNDLVTIRVNPSVPNPVQNDCIMVGMISEIKRIGDFNNASVVYQVTGMSVSKALMQLNLGTIQELQGMLTGNAGWMMGINGLSNDDSDSSDDNDKDKKNDPQNPSDISPANYDGKHVQGLFFNGKRAADVVNQIISWFLFQHTSYQYLNGTKSIADMFTLDLSSRPEEFLTDPTPITSYDGSLRQLITQAQAAPFNEFFNDFTPDGKELLTMRPTPFEPDDWHQLEADSIQISDEDIMEESISQTDAEQYSIFEVSVPANVVMTASTGLMSSPMYYPELAVKYGYNPLVKENRYIFQSKVKTSSSSNSSDISSNLPAISSADVSSIAGSTLAWTDKKGITASKLNAFIHRCNPGCAFDGHGDYFIEAGEKSGLNPVYILCHAAIESSWGGSAYGTGAHNYFGIGAFDNNPDNATNYGNNSMESGIVNGAVWIRKNFYDKGHQSLNAMKAAGYATSPSWVNNIATQMALYYKINGINSDTSKSLTDFMNKVNNEYNKGGDTTPESGLEKSVDAFFRKVNHEYDSKSSPSSSKSKSSTVKKSSGKKSTSSSKDKSSKQDSQKALDSGNKNRMKQYSTYLANWYGDDASFLSGTYRVIGNPDYRIGNVLQRGDHASLDSNGQPQVIEFYLEAVSHEFNLTSGYTSLLGVTRGLPVTAGVDRFAHWNKSIPFVGGLFGEASLDQLYSQAMKDQDSDGDSDSDSDDDGTPSGSGKGDDYPAKWKNAGPDTLVDDWAYYNRECTSFAAWRQHELGVADSLIYHLGNAGEWGGKRSQYLSHTPHTGDVAWYAAGTVSPMGHVGYIAGVKGDKVTVEEYNRKPYAYDSVTVPASSISGFLHFPHGGKGSIPVTNNFQDIPKIPNNLSSLTGPIGDQSGFNQEVYKTGTPYLSDADSGKYSYGSGNNIIGLANYYANSGLRSQFKFQLSQDSALDPLQKDPILVDDATFVGWVYYESLVDSWTEDDAQTTPEKLFNNDLLYTVSTGASSMTGTEKTGILLNNGQAGDIIFFDTFQRNGMVGLYMGVDDKGVPQFISCVGNPGDSNSGIMKLALVDNWLDSFNGVIRRPRA